MSLKGDVLNVLVGLMKEDRDTFVPARLSILVHLYFTQSTVFTSLQKTLKLTSGNLSSHLKKLQSLGLVRISKEFIELKPTTTVVITQEGAEKVRSQLLRLRELVSVVIEQEVVEQPSDADTSTASTL